MQNAPVSFSELIEKPLKDIIPGLGDSNNVRTVKATDRIPRLVNAMDVFKIRTMPIEDGNRKLLGVVSQADVAKALTPPIAKLPIEYLRSKGFNMNDLFDENEKIRVKTVEDVFDFVFDFEKPVISWNNNLKDAIKKLDERDGNNRRNRTLIIVDDEERVAGTLSYVDVLRIVRNGIGIDGFLTRKNAGDILNTQVEALATNEGFDDAKEMLDYLPFTHIPITTVKGGNTVVGIVDDIAIRTLEHSLLYPYFQNMTISEILESDRSLKISDKFVVKDNVSVRILIGKFVDDKNLRPTAILVGELTGEKLNMAGIISYVDIFRKLMAFIDDMKKNQLES